MAEEKEQLVNGQDSGRNRRLDRNLLNSPEGRCLLIGTILSLAFILWLGRKILLSPEDSQFLIGMTATQFIFGRAAGIAFGYSMGLSNSTVITICVMIETIMVLIFYPLFVFSWRQLLVIKQLRNVFGRVRKLADARKDIVKSYGVIGLFIFVWLPFWMTGPVVGCVIGFMMGLRVWLNMTVVLSGTYVAIIGWAVFLRKFHDNIVSYSSYATMTLLILLLVMIIAGHLLHRRFYEKKNKT